MNDPVTFAFDRLPASPIRLVVGLLPQGVPSKLPLGWMDCEPQTWGSWMANGGICTAWISGEAAAVMLLKSAAQLAARLELGSDSNWLAWLAVVVTQNGNPFAERPRRYCPGLNLLLDDAAADILGLTAEPFGEYQLVADVVAAVSWARAMRSEPKSAPESAPKSAPESAPESTQEPQADDFRNVEEALRINVEAALRIIVSESQRTGKRVKWVRIDLLWPDNLPELSIRDQREVGKVLKKFGFANSKRGAGWAPFARGIEHCRTSPGSADIAAGRLLATKGAKGR